MDRKERTDGFTAVEDRFSGYKVYDRDGDKIGKVDDLFLDENDRPEYVGVRMGFFGLSSALVPMDAVRVHEVEQALYVDDAKDRVKDGPRFDDDKEITPDFERQVREYYGLGAVEGERGSYGGYYGDEDHEEAGRVGPGMTLGDTESGRFEGHGLEEEGVGRDDDRSDLEDEDELRVRRSEEELRAGVREREAGVVNVRKRVKTEREQVRVPKRREEVAVDRVPVEGEASGSEIGEDEMSVPVVEEEVVAEKRPVVKEEIRVRKDVVRDEEVVEEDVRKEEVDIDDETAGRRRG
ncbi:MAG: PRC and DUF2382 domain-containing protein [Actinomycetota bacterium]|nr:PRC and DUF2382 domain-containing protein [Actinomycetota bacterium]